MVPAYMSAVSPPQSRWIGPEAPTPYRGILGTADATGPGKCSSCPGPDGGPVRLEAGWDQFPRERDPQLFFRGRV